MVPVETILKEALELPADLRADLVRQLMCSLPTPVAPVPVTRAEDTPITWEGAQGFLED